MPGPERGLPGPERGLTGVGRGLTGVDVLGRFRACRQGKIGPTEAVIAFTTYGLGDKSALAYNAARVVGTGLGTIFRYFSYKKWVFLAGAAGAAAAAGEAAVSGIVDSTETSEAGAVLAGMPDGHRLPFEQLDRADTDLRHR